MQIQSQSQPQQYSDQQLQSQSQQYSDQQLQSQSQQSSDQQSQSQQSIDQQILNYYDNNGYLENENISDRTAKHFSDHIAVLDDIDHLMLHSVNISNIGLMYLAEGIKRNDSTKSIEIMNSNIGDSGASAFFTNVFRDNFQYDLLDFTGNNITSLGARILADNIKKKKFKFIYFRFSNNNIGDVGAKILAKCFEKNKFLQDLSLESNNINDEGMEALAKSLRNTQILDLYLDHNNLGINGAKAFNKLLKNNRTLKHLNLNNNNIDDNNVKELFSGLKESKIEFLHLDSNNIGDDGAVALGEALKVSRISSLHIKNNNIGATGTTALAEAFKVNNTISYVNLDENNSGDTGATALAEFFKVNKSIRSMHLGQNNIGATGAEALAEALKVNNTISYVNLANNNIGATGAVALGEALKVNKSITHLYFSNNNIGDRGAEALAEALKVNRTITHVYLKNNNIGARGAEALAEALKVNRTITYVYLENNNIGDTGAEALAVALNTNRKLFELDLDNNLIGDDGAIAFAINLAGNNTFNGLRIRNNNITEAGLDALRQRIRSASESNHRLIIYYNPQNPRMPTKQQKQAMNRVRNKKFFNQLLENPNSDEFYIDGDYTIRKIQVQTYKDGERKKKQVYIIDSKMDSQKDAIDFDKSKKFQTKQAALNFARLRTIDPGILNLTETTKEGNTQVNNQRKKGIKRKYLYLSDEDIEKIILKQNRYPYVRPADPSRTMTLISGVQKNRNSQQENNSQQQQQKYNREKNRISTYDQFKKTKESLVLLNKKNKQNELNQALKTIQLLNLNVNNNNINKILDQIRRKGYKNIQQDNGVFENMNQIQTQLINQYELFKYKPFQDTIFLDDINQLAISKDSLLNIDRKNIPKVVEKKLSKYGAKYKSDGGKETYQRKDFFLNKNQVQQAIQSTKDQEKKKLYSGILQRFQEFQKKKELNKKYELNKEEKEEQKQLKRKKENEIKLKEIYLQSFKLALQNKQTKIKQLGKDPQYIREKRAMIYGKNENSNSKKIKRMEMLIIQKEKNQAQIKRLTQQIKKLKPPLNQRQLQQKLKQKYTVTKVSSRGYYVKFENDKESTFLTQQEFQKLNPAYEFLLTEQQLKKIHPELFQ